MKSEGRHGTEMTGNGGREGPAHCGNWPLAVCSWSLRLDIAGVATAMGRLNIGYVNLALKPAFRDGGQAYLDAVAQQRWTISATTIGFPQEDYSSLERIRATGGIVPDECWPENRTIFERCAAITAETGVPFLTMHAGFIEGGDETQCSKIRDRMAMLADIAAGRGISLLMETGQETAEALRDFLVAVGHPKLGVNFDPANMILYDKGDPVDAVRTLGRWIKHVHVKDAVRTKFPGTWGTEVPWGEGEVGGDRFLRALGEVGFRGVLAIEREAGDDRFRDIAAAVGRLTNEREA